MLLRCGGAMIYKGATRQRNAQRNVAVGASDLAAGRLMDMRFKWI
jgi:hypothetical protein